MKKKSCFINIKVLTFLVVISSLLLAACDESNANSDHYPNQVVDVNVGFDAGSQSDTTARIITQHGDKHFDESFNIVNSPGSAGLISYEKIYGEKADGHSLVLGTATLIVHDLLGDLSYDYDELTPIITFQTDPLVMYASKDAPFKTAQELVDYAREHPGELQIATGSPGGLGNVFAQVFEQKMDLDLDIVPYEGSGSEPVTQTAGGNMQVSIGGTSEGIAHVKEGSIVVLGSTSDISGLIEDAPTFEEQDLDVGMIGNIRSIFGPPEMPQEIVDILYEAFKKGTDEEGFDEYIKDNGVTKKVLNGEETMEFYKQQEEIMKPILSDE